MKLYISSLVAFTSLGLAADCDNDQGNGNLKGLVSWQYGVCTDFARNKGDAYGYKVYTSNFVCTVASSKVGNQLTHCNEAVPQIVSQCNGYSHGIWSYDGETYQCAAFPPGGM
jgi:hypothetical protein